jgi:AraC family transcriptional regulator, ethanolamine operon transcriptional activator
MQLYRRTATTSEEELGRAVPGATCQLVADSGPSFTGRFRYLVLDGVVLTRLEVDQASILTLSERTRDFSIWHMFSSRCLVNGNDVHGDDLAMVRQGEGATLHSATAAHVQSFALQPTLLAEAPELDLPFGPSTAPRAGRWRIASSAARQRFVAQHQALLRQLDERPELLEHRATRTALRNAVLEAIARLGEAGTFRPDRASVGRHTRIMVRFEEVVEETGDEPLSMLEICRRTGTSRRLLESVVQHRTGKPPWEYLRWRRLWRARALLSRPDADTTVTDVAFRLGFWHLGRFAAAYAETFGERPSLTLARATGRINRLRRAA